jgi:hypothetical protein
MIKRCTNPKTIRFNEYGGRGISVCDRWLNSFENFLSDMGEKPPGLSIDRIDNDGNYEPGNCRWATVEQQNNNQRNNIRLSYDGKTMTLSQWARHYGILKGTLWMRYRRAGDRPPYLFRPVVKMKPGKN